MCCRWEREGTGEQLRHVNSGGGLGHMILYRALGKLNILEPPAADTLI